MLSVSEIVAKTEAMFDLFNHHFYNDELTRPAITVSPDGGRGAYGWCSVYEIWQASGEAYREINICAEYIDRPIGEVAATMLHEMAHLYNLTHEIKDVSNNGYYHNKKFKETAEAHGLHIEYSEHIGWSLTSLPEETRAWIKENINIKDIRIYKRIAEKDSDKETKPKQSMRKLICPNCGAIARVTSPDTLLICGSCYNEEAKAFYLQEEF